MILVADSGSTKTNWLMKGSPLMETIGFNPLFNTTDDIYREISKSKELNAINDSVTQIYFYGASCSSPERIAIVFNALKKLFTKAEIHVDHDMMGAAIATYDGRRCITCILGTGSNACMYDGHEIDYTIQRGMGYILGDEASGSYFGKKLITAFLYKELPQATYDLMLQTYGLTKENILHSVYNEPNANVYLANFAKVLTSSPDQDYMQAMVKEGFRDFFRHDILCFEGYQSMPVHFIGSIAYNFKPILQQVADEHGCELGTVIRQPIFNLLEYHERVKATA